MENFNFIKVTYTVLMFISQLNILIFINHVIAIIRVIK